MRLVRLPFPQIWDSVSGKCLHTLVGHEKEIVCVAFNPQGDLLATGSTDHTARLWNVETGQCVFKLDKHDAEIVSLHFTTEGDKLLTGSFDHTCRIWDVRQGTSVRGTTIRACGCGGDHLLAVENAR